jgi:hypothetical protein
MYSYASKIIYNTANNKPNIMLHIRFSMSTEPEKPPVQGCIPKE